MNDHSAASPSHACASIGFRSKGGPLLRQQMQRNYGNRCKGIAPKGLFTHQRNVSGLNHRSPFPESEDCIFRVPTVFSLASGSDFWFPGMVSPDGETSSTLALEFSLGDCFSSCTGLAGSAA